MRHKLANGDSHGTRRTSSEYGVFDETTGKCVGAVSFDKVPPRRPQELPHRTIRLFDSKYVGINTHMECVAYAEPPWATQVMGSTRRQGWAIVQVLLLS